MTAREYIESIEVIPVVVPRRGSIRLQRGATPPTSPFTIVRVTTQSGAVGYGEGCTTGTGLDVVARNHLVEPLLGHDVFDLTGIHKRMDAVEMMLVERLSHWNVVRAAIDMAMWDLHGKLLGVPIYDLLGGKQRDTVEIIKNIGVSDVETSAATARQLVADGFRAVKIRVGQDQRLDMERVAAVRDAVGPDVRVRLDANQAWDAVTAVAMIGRLAQFNLEAVESPCPYWDIRAAAEVVSRVSVPIIADEGFWTLGETRMLLAAGGANALHLYLGKNGGITPGRKIAALAEAFHVSLTPGERVPLGIAEAAHAHFAAALPTLPYPCALAYDLNEHDLLTTSLAKKDGCLVVPEGIGLGVDVDIDRLEHYRVHESF